MGRYNRTPKDKPKDDNWHFAGEPQPKRIPIIGGITRREALFGVVGVAGVTTAAVSGLDLEDIPHVGIATLATTGNDVREIAIDNTDRNLLSPLQSTALKTILLETDKAQYTRGLQVRVSVFGTSAHDPLNRLFDEVSPGNEAAANPFWDSRTRNEEEWQTTFRPAFSAAIDQCLLPASQPEETHLISATNVALRHGRHAAGPDGVLTVKLASDMLVHVDGGMSAYVSERSSRHPVNAMAGLSQDRFNSPGLTRIELVGIRRDGRKTRSGRDLGEVQRQVAALVVEYYKARGAEVSLTWV